MILENFHKLTVLFALRKSFGVFLTTKVVGLLVPPPIKRTTRAQGWMLWALQGSNYRWTPTIRTWDNPDRVGRNLTVWESEQYQLDFPPRTILSTATATAGLQLTEQVFRSCIRSAAARAGLQHPHQICSTRIRSAAAGAGPQYPHPVWRTRIRSADCCWCLSPRLRIWFFLRADS